MKDSNIENIYRYINTFLFNYTWSETFFCLQTSRLQLPPSASCIRHSDQRATCLRSRSVFPCGTGTWPGWRRWRLRSEHTTQSATAGALMFEAIRKIWWLQQRLQEMKRMVWCCCLFSIFTDTRGAPGTSVTLAACLFLFWLRRPRGCPTAVCALQMTSSDSLKFSLPLIKEEDKDPWRCSPCVLECVRTVGSPPGSQCFLSLLQDSLYFCLNIYLPCYLKTLPHNHVLFCLFWFLLHVGVSFMF